MAFYDMLINEVDVKVLAVAYRGYSGNEGSPNEVALKKDSETLINFIKSPSFSTKINPKQIYLFGRNIGGSVSIYMAHKASTLFRGLIVENTFSSTPDLVHDLFTFVKYVKSLITDTWYSRDLVGTLQLPILFIAGAADTTVLPHHSIELQKLSKKSAFSSSYIVEEGGHNSTW